MATYKHYFVINQQFLKVRVILQRYESIAWKAGSLKALLYFWISVKISVQWKWPSAQKRGQRKRICEL